jgi:enediyne biosynthesis protein E4
MNSSKKYSDFKQIESRLKSKFYLIKAISFLMILLLLPFVGCKNREGKSLFELVSPNSSKIVFNNVITETDSLNILTYEYIYNGGGVAIADFDNDGLEDVFFSGNMVENALYKNLGNLKFEDITATSGVAAKDRWCTGVNIIDINQDGKKDIYITTTKHEDANLRKNLLYINTSEGNNISFEEKAEEYGIADTSYSMNAIFFDYDNDGDLDLLIINNKLLERNDVSTYKRGKNSKESGRVDKLFRNDFDSIRGHAYFTDVSDAAGIVYEGFSLGVNVCDINNDGWKDIYITNDFITNDLLYINNQDGTFSNKLSDYIKHTSFSAMGNDIADINNDGLPDIIALDMLPETNYRKKTMLGPNNYTSYINNISYGYTHQHIRNTLQLNMGLNPSKSHPVFSEIAMLSGIEATDWSWAPLVADFDNDGFRDIIITNGFPRDITDRDFMEYQANDGFYVDNTTLLSKIPEVKLTNYAYRNKGNLQFENVTTEWGITLPTFSNGGAYADLDNDGDLDYIVNNINDIAHIYENKSKNSNYVKLTIIGEKPNIDGIGTIIKYTGPSISSVYEHSLSRGYLSSVTPTVNIGLGTDSLVNLEIIWPDNTVSLVENVKANQTLILDKSKLDVIDKTQNGGLQVNSLLQPIFDMVKDTCREIDFNDFNIDPLLIKKLSNTGQGIAVGDINQDGDDDFYIAGSRGYHGKLYLSSNTGYKSSVIQPNAVKEETSPVFVDIDGDGDLDLYIGCGSIESTENDNSLQDILLLNENGVFKDVSHLLPQSNTITKTVEVADYDQDGDFDLFIGKGHQLNKYPRSSSSYVLVNNSTKDKITLTPDEKPFQNLDMLVSDALWTDMDGDNDLDLIVVGDFTGIMLFENVQGKLTLASDHPLTSHTGFWNSINGADLDGDGDIDYVIGNFGWNNLIRPSQERPLRIYAKDFDGNSSMDFLPTTYFLNTKSAMEETTFNVKGDLVKELNFLRKKYLYHKNLALAPIDSIITNDMKIEAIINQVITFSSIVLINKGNKNFEIQQLPVQSQFSPIYGILLEDFDQDGKIDILYQGNNYGIEVGMGRMDAGYGGLLKNMGNLEFKYIAPYQSGFFADGEFRSISTMVKQNQSYTISTQINGPISFYASTFKDQKVHNIPRDIKSIQYFDKDDQLIYVLENYQTAGYLSQPSSTKIWPFNAVKAKLKGNKNEEIIKYANELQ